MNDLFYHQATKVLFWVAEDFNNISKAIEIADSIKSKAIEFAKIANVSELNVLTANIRYIQKRVFFLNDFNDSTLESIDSNNNRLWGKSVRILKEKSVESMWEFIRVHYIKM